MLLSGSTESFEVDLRRVSVHSYGRMARELSRSAVRAPLSALRCLKIKGGSVHSDRAFFRDVESMCRDLVEAAPALEELHLPILSNHALRSLSDMEK